MGIMIVCDPCDTIVALSTPAGAAPVAILRVSGDRACEIVGLHFRPSSGQRLDEARTYTAVSGRLVLPSGVGLPASVYVMRAPYSYTREDVYEIHMVGSPPLVEMALGALIRAGARLAAPGEFTRRAFLNGRLDLAQAESVMAIVRSRSEAELRAATQQLRGALAEAVRWMREELSALCALVEVSIDFSDQDIEVFSPDDMVMRLRKVEQELERINVGGARRVCDEAITAVITGEPNVGKSSLLNALVERFGQKAHPRRALVSPVPGTTRDTLEAFIQVQGVIFRLVDTAGLREPADEVEASAVHRARAAQSEAALVLRVLDATAMSEAKEEAVGGPTITVFNKVDLVKTPVRAHAANEVLTSAVTGEGIEDLARRMAQIVLSGELDRSGSLAVINARHQEAFERAREAVALAQQNVGRGENPELVALELRTALNAIGEIVGEVTTQEILDRIFGQFCIGK